MLLIDKSTTDWNQLLITVHFIIEVLSGLLLKGISCCEKGLTCQLGSPFNVGVTYQLIHDF